jgi:hypothetical protein
VAPTGVGRIRYELRESIEQLQVIAALSARAGPG